MKTKELVTLVNQGAQPIVKINDSASVLEGPEDGMLGRVKSVGKKDRWDENNITINFFIDFLEFTEQNKSFATADWYDKDRNPTLTWMETEFYKRDSKKFELFEMLIEYNEYGVLRHLTIVEENKWLNKYLEESPNTSYIRWLEKELDKLSHEV